MFIGCATKFLAPDSTKCKIGKVLWCNPVFKHNMEILLQGEQATLTNVDQNKVSKFCVGIEIWLLRSFSKEGLSA